MIPIDFQGHMFKVKVKLLFRAHCVVRSISFDPFTWSIPNLVHGLRLIIRWSLLIYRSHIQSWRSNYSFEPSVLSTFYCLIPCLLTSDRVCFHRHDKPDFCTMVGIYVSDAFLVFINTNLYKSLWLCSMTKHFQWY